MMENGGRIDRAPREIQPYISGDIRKSRAVSKSPAMMLASDCRRIKKIVGFPKARHIVKVSLKCLGIRKTQERLERAPRKASLTFPRKVMMSGAADAEIRVEHNFSQVRNLANVTSSRGRYTSVSLPHDIPRMLY